MKLGEELHALEAAGRDDREYMDRPNVCVGERVSGCVVGEGRKAVFVTAAGRRVKFETERTTRRSGAATATVIENIGRQPRAFDLRRDG